MKNAYVCIHSHFYQPPRENPWLEVVETEKSAAPYHDWNSRITHECYGPNASSRILKGGKIDTIENNYLKMSFNFGATLLTWMEKNEPVVYRAIIEADRESCKAHNGHGNAIAQVYNHSIMPLNSTRDKETQIIWGIRDFEVRFGRRPEGMWLAETAVDAETLTLAAKHGILFTILAPHQARRVRPIKEKSAAWKKPEHGVDTTQPYLYKTADGGAITLFFYDGELSNAIAFKGALNDGKGLGEDMIKRARVAGEERLVHIATDGESYGHHHQFGEMALSAALNTIEREATITNYGEYLSTHPPTMEADIHENSSWSCAHGVERWRTDCGCNISGNPGWNQKWRAPLRSALTHLKNKLDEIFEAGVAQYVRSPWEARNDYVHVLLDRSDARMNVFLAKHSHGVLAPHQVVETMKFFEMQRNAMRMFTSCGWFFDDISGLESMQILKYAARSIDLQQEVSLVWLEEQFVEELSKAESNMKEKGNGADLYLKKVRPLRVDPQLVAAHKAMMNVLSEEQKSEQRLHCYRIEAPDEHVEEYLDTRLYVGRLRLTSTLTMEMKEYVYCLLHYGGHDFSCAVRPLTDVGMYHAMKVELTEAFRKHAVPEMVHAVKRHFGEQYFTLKDLFEGERKKILSRAIIDRIHQFGETYQSLFERNRKLMDYFVDLGVPVPREFKIAAQYVLEYSLNGLFLDSGGRDDIKVMTATMADAERWGITPNCETLQANITGFLERGVENLCLHGDCNDARIIIAVMDQVRGYGLDINYWQVQNTLYPFVEASREPMAPLHNMVVGIVEFKRLFEIFGFYVEA